MSRCAVLRYLGKLRDVFVAELQVDDTEGARVLTEREAAEEVAEPFDPPNAYERELIARRTSAAHGSAAVGPGGGESGVFCKTTAPAVGQPMPSVDDLRMAAMGIDARFQHGDWRALADRLRNLADFWTQALK